jgi:hypothetical protein
MSRVASNVPCGDPSRLFMYERLTAPFYQKKPTTKGTCSICGTPDIDLDVGNKICLAQAALTQKRNTAADGYPVAYGSPPKKGRFSMTDAFCALLVEDDYAVFTGKVLPERPLPAGAEIRTDLRFEDLLDRVMQDPKPPYILVSYNQKADIPITASTSPSTIVINGTSPPVKLQRKRLLQLVDMISLHGKKTVEAASKMRSLTHLDKATASKLHAKLAEESPAILKVIEDVPNGMEPEYGYASLIVWNRLNPKSSGAAAEESPTATKTEQEVD